MGILSKIIGDSAAGPITAIGNVFDQLFTSDEEKAQAEAVLLKLAQQPDILQAEINKIEAGHRTIFVAGWRPFIGWVCGLGIAYAYIIYPLLVWFAAYLDPSVQPPALIIDNLLELVLALLGMSGLRTFEKIKGKSK